MNSSSARPSLPLEEPVGKLRIGNDLGCIGSANRATYCLDAPCKPGHIVGRSRPRFRPRSALSPRGFSRIDLWSTANSDLDADHRQTTVNSRMRFVIAHFGVGIPRGMDTRRACNGAQYVRISLEFLGLLGKIDKF